MVFETLLREVQGQKDRRGAYKWAKGREGTKRRQEQASASAVGVQKEVVLHKREDFRGICMHQSGQKARRMHVFCVDRSTSRTERRPFFFVTLSSPSATSSDCGRCDCHDEALCRIAKKEGGSDGENRAYDSDQAKL